jgi:hypothetical protein
MDIDIERGTWPLSAFSIPVMPSSTLFSTIGHALISSSLITHITSKILI